MVIGGKSDVFDSFGHKKTSAVFRQQKCFVGLGLKI